MPPRPLSLLCLLPFALPAFAEEPKPPPTPLDQAVESYLDAVHVTALRGPGRALDTPYSVETASAKSLRQGLVRSAPQALAAMPGVLVQETSPAQGSPFLRGFTGYLTLFLVDGIRLNNSTFRAGPNQYFSTVDLFSVARLELVKGPASVLYGSDAVGGAVQAFTKGPTTWGEGWRGEGHAFYRVSSAENSHQTRIEGGATSGTTWGAFGGVTVRHFGDVEAGGDVGRQGDTGYDEVDGDIKIERRAADGSRVVAAFQHVRQNNAPRTHRLVTAVPFHGTVPGSDLRHDFDQERWLAYVQYMKEAIGGAIDAVRVSLSWQSQEEVRDRVRPPSSPGGANRRDVEGVDVGTLGFFVQLESETAIGRLTYGLDFYHDDVDSFSTANAIQGPVGDDASYDLFGIYLQDVIVLTDRLTVTPGVRLTFAAADAGKVRDPLTGGAIAVSESWAAVAGSIRVLYKIAPGRWHIFGGVSQGFRAPNLSDLTRFDTARSNEVEIPAPGLDPEHYTGFELGVKASSKRGWMELALFATLIRDQILPFPTGVTDAAGLVEVSKANVGDGSIWGVEWSGGWRVRPAWTVFAILQFQRGRVSTFTSAARVEMDEPVSRLLPPSGRLGLRWEGTDGRFWAESVLVFADKADRLSSGDKRDTQRIPPGGTPGYGVVHLRGGCRIGEHVSVTVAVENLLDKAYRVHGSGTTMPGINFVLGVSGDF
ncbi:MAG: TonB-dependent receptor [Planctomycetaceae bacterium]